MSTSARLAGAALALALSADAVLGAALPASSSAPPPAPSAPPSAIVLPVLTGADIPREASLPPNAGEWTTGRSVRINRGNPGPCRASVVREWLRLRCPTVLGGGLFAGDPQGVSVSAVGDPFADGSSPEGAQNRAVTTVVLPLQRGQVRAVSLLQLVQGYNSASYGEAGMFSVVWRADQPDPMLVMTQLPAPEQR